MINFQNDLKEIKMTIIIISIQNFKKGKLKINQLPSHLLLLLAPKHASLIAICALINKTHYKVTFLHLCIKSLLIIDNRKQRVKPIATIHKLVIHHKVALSISSSICVQSLENPNIQIQPSIAALIHNPHCCLCPGPRICHLNTSQDRIEIINQ